MPQLDPARKQQLIRLAQLLIDQEQARIVVPPNQPRSGFWFGGGNLVEADDGTLFLVGRYRNSGDSRSAIRASSSTA